MSSLSGRHCGRRRGREFVLARRITAAFVTLVFVSGGCNSERRTPSPGSAEPAQVEPRVGEPGEPPSSPTAAPVTAKAPKSAGSLKAGDPRAAAEGYVELVGSLTYVEPEDAERLLAERVASSGAAEVDAQLETLDKKQARLRGVAKGGHVWQVGRVFGSRTAVDTADTARVDVWWCWFTSASGFIDPIVSWNIATVDLVVENGAWRVARFSNELGPAPMLGVDVIPTSGPEFDAATTGMGLPTEVVADHAG